MDFQKLKQLFPNLSRVQSEDESFFTFRVKGQLYAIPEQELNYEQKQLIQAFSDDEILHTQEEKNWLKFLNVETEKAPGSYNHFRFIVMNLQNQNYDAKSLKESISLILNKRVLFFWHHSHQLVLLEDLDSEPIPFEEIIDVMSDDLDLNIKLVVGNSLENVEEAPRFYKWFTQIAEQILDYTSKRLVYQEDALFLLLPQKYTGEERHYFTQSILRDSINEPDLIKTIKTVIEHHGNVSAAAKTLYMHRNSVQYRIEKFQDLTNKDIKDFKDMLDVYLAIQLIES
ncbi:PucR family transcriptional regulator [Piscibacillus sp. B03]|uniref:PucR family transcriptional regulator n=1 Tax=Piscibacillus sp. B03 TaxID=3457430 RepID=UPI003FCD6D3B